MKQIISFRSLLTAASFAILSFTACNDGADADNHDDDSANAVSADTSSSTMPAGNADHAMATLSGTKPDTTVTGTAHFSRSGDKVKMKLDIEVPKKANSSVAIHFHAMGDCGDMGKHAGGHWNPTNKNHGKWGSESFHSGDIGNIDLDANGKATFELETDLWSIGGTDSTKNILNKTIIIHSGKDDYKTQPTGNSGERIGCGVITQANM